MKLASFVKDGKITWGGVTGERLVDLAPKFGARFADLKAMLAGGGQVGLSPFIETGKDWMPLQVGQFLPVIPNPGKIFCVGVNYADHQKEMGRSKLEHPTIFLRFTDTLIGHGQAAWIPRISPAVDYECELAVIIGKGGRYIEAARALDHVAGYTCFNDISIRDWQRHTTQFTAGKNFPRTGALGPWMVTADEIPDPHSLSIKTRLNGKVMQDSNTSELIFKIPELIAYLSSFTPLSPGDVIATGTPSGVGFARNPPVFMKAGDTVEVEIASIGVLKNVLEMEPA
ncbi:MAG: fumarylacetoacetate hydrolase family protein [Vicinamibacteria bacterium]|jgi:2-keto-4-pentenoate hydratase/2-oxohepta-3-ene-1,7-dioic acid hydratase in catechol pathway|nr:fumarylacetoacetate hydrolase family protein [Vicinamibacteria bacterium]